MVQLPSADPWIKWTKKILIEEGHLLPQLTHILQLLARHPNLFYPCRGQFVPHIVHSLVFPPFLSHVDTCFTYAPFVLQARIGLLPNSSSENRRLAVELVELILAWEKQRIQDTQISSAAQPAENVVGSTSTSAPSYTSPARNKSAADG